jgi:hypothetical protein
MTCQCLPCRYYGGHVLTDAYTLKKPAAFKAYTTIFSIGFLALGFYLALIR